MVIAEIPLWVVHSNNNSTNSNGTNSEVAITTTPTTASAVATAQNAIQSYYASSTTASTNNNGTTTSSNITKKNKKCAIYSIDTYQDLFVTGGGDGAIRIWNSLALFCNSSKSTSSSKKTSEVGANESTPTAAAAAGTKGKGAHYDETTGAYVSSEGSDDQEQNDDDDDDDDVDSEEKEEDNIGKDVIDTNTSTTTAAAIHDLNANVRSKHHSPQRKGTIPTEQQQQQVATAAAAATAVSSSMNISHQQQQPLKGLNDSSKLLCTVQAHTGSSVLCVRFSYSGQYIASAGDDGCVCIYSQQQQLQLNHTSSTSASTATITKNLEQHHSNNKNNNNNWIRIKLCRGHELDVVDLAWSPIITDDYLVSCSLDSNTPIIVWKLQLSSSQNQHSKNNSVICHPYKILGQNVHTSTVKGVAFDPAGSYLASSGDDPAICIWRTHDDWGLIKRIDHTSGIFRTWKQQSNNSNNENDNTYEDDIQALSNQSLFRRISWSTDGAFLCSTNSVVKNKHVASTISREKWHVSGSGSTTNNHTSSTGTAANLVGHKQPIVVCRHASQLLHTKKNSDSDDNYDDSHDTVPEYATLLALGDRRGFVTIWSTRKSRPLFKVQCSESHCTVTDLAWGRIQRITNTNKSEQQEDIALILFVSLLDGQVVVFRFAIPDELGYVLSDTEKVRVFQLRYGIDIHGDENNDMDVSFGRRFGKQRVGFDGIMGGPALIENALQMSYEDNRKVEEIDDDNDNNNITMDDSDNMGDVAPISQQQEESRSVSGKKRIRPVLVQTISGLPPNKQQKTNSSSIATTTQQSKSIIQPTNPLQNAMSAAERAITAAESGAQTLIRKDKNPVSGSAIADNCHNGTFDDRQRNGRNIIQSNRPTTSSVVPALQYSTKRVHSADLPTFTDPNGNNLDVLKNSIVTADCINSTKVPLGSKSEPLSCIDISITSNGRTSWTDQIVGTSCTSISASRMILAVGTSDGTIQMYGTSPTIGWSCGTSFRSHPPLILGAPIVFLQLNESKSDNQSDTCKAGNIEILVVAADGMFGVWSVVPKMHLQYKGTIMPILTHMSHAAAVDTLVFPKLARVQVAESGHLLAILSYESSSKNDSRQGDVMSSSQTPSVHYSTGPGGSIQAFIYDRPCELWMRVSDSRFLLSDFYTTLPTTMSATKLSSNGVLNKIDDVVRLGSIQSSLKAGHRNRIADRHTNEIYEQSEEEYGNFIASRSHCEDRMACALVMNSLSEFKLWLRNFVRILVVKGESSQLRLLIDMILQNQNGTDVASTDGQACWWMFHGSTILSEDRVSLVKELVIPEMSRSRRLQRLTNEISIEVNSL